MHSLPSLPQVHPLTQWAEVTAAPDRRGQAPANPLPDFPSVFRLFSFGPHIHKDPPPTPRGERQLKFALHRPAQVCGFPSHSSSASRTAHTSLKPQAPSGVWLAVADPCSQPRALPSPSSFICSSLLFGSTTRYGTHIARGGGLCSSARRGVARPQRTGRLPPQASFLNELQVSPTAKSMAQHMQPPPQMVASRSQPKIRPHFSPATPGPYPSSTTILGSQLKG